MFYTILQSIFPCKLKFSLPHNSGQSHTVVLQHPRGPTNMGYHQTVKSAAKENTHSMQILQNISQNINLSCYRQGPASTPTRHNKLTSGFFQPQLIWLGDFEKSPYDLQSHDNFKPDRKINAPSDIHAISIKNVRNSNCRSFLQSFFFWIINLRIQRW